MQHYWDAHALVRELSWPQLIFADTLRNAIRGRTVLDIGCGGGTLSAHLLDLGADTVVGLDFSQAMIGLARDRFRETPRLRFLCEDILDSNLHQRFDLITGIAILHEIPSGEYPRLIQFLDDHLERGGFGWFQENSYFNPLVRWFRRNMVGRWGVPRYGSSDETPFDHERFHFLAEHFAYCERSVESFVFFQLVNHYVLRERIAWLGQVGDSLDRRISSTTRFESLKLAWSYYQHVYLSHREAKVALFAPR